jgi:hypothetical protein
VSKPITPEDTDLKSWMTSVLAGAAVCLMAVPSFARYEAPDDQVALVPQVQTVPVDPASEAPLPIQTHPEVDGAVPQPPTSAPLQISLVDRDAAIAAGVTADVLHLAVNAVECAVNSGDIAMPPTLTLIDYSRPSVEPRLWVFDTHSGQLLYKELVAHGKGTGENMATQFSDTDNSHQSSLGLFVTADTYIGQNGYSLRLNGLEPGFNSRARDRAIVMHGAPYVDAQFAAKQGRLGRSWGCPALREAVAHKVIDTVRDGGVIFSYYPDQQWLKTSRFLNCRATAATTTLATN